MTSSISSEDREYELFYHSWDQYDLDFRKTVAAIEQRYSNRTERRKFYDWTWKYGNEYHQRQETNNNPVSLTDFVNCFRQTNFRNLESMSRLAGLVMSADYFPFMPLGWCKGMLYEIRPDTTILQPSRRPDEKDGRPLVDSPGVLGCNQTVEPSFPKQSRRDQNRSNESTNSTNSDDIQLPRADELFIFQQVGGLGYYDGDYDRRNEKGDVGGWLNSNYVVVTEITSGRPEGVWNVYNWWRYDEDDNELYHVDDKYNGIFPSRFYQDYISCAKIGENFTQWSFSDDPRNTFGLDHIIKNEPELVHVRQGQTGGILMRETVEKSY